MVRARWSEENQGRIGEILKFESLPKDIHPEILKELLSFWDQVPILVPGNSFKKQKGIPSLREKLRKMEQTMLPMLSRFLLTDHDLGEWESKVIKLFADKVVDHRQVAMPALEHSLDAAIKSGDWERQQDRR
jgi:hypothetical protein